MNVTDISRESVIEHAAFFGYNGGFFTQEFGHETAAMLRALLSAKEQAEREKTNAVTALLDANTLLRAERDALKALCGELIAKHEKVVAWLIRYAEMHEKAAKDTRFQTLAVADAKAAANYRATAADIQPLLTRARSLL